jgi:hypothetical protein
MNPNEPRHLCPVCWRPVTRTYPNHNINGHTDKAGNPCPASHTPFYTTINDTREPTHT